jgi:putative MATE family efflux protein
MTTEQLERGTKNSYPSVSAKPVSPRDRMLRGPILATLLRLSAPNVGEAMARVAFIAFDAVFIGWLGTDALAGVSLVFPIFLIMQMMSASGLGAGTAAAIARSLGADRQSDANRVAGQGILLALAAAGISAAIFLALGPMIYQWMGAEGESLTAATTYSTLVFSGIVVVWLMNVLANVVRGTGNMVVPASAIVAGEILHLSLGPVLILGLGPFPALGVSGAAVAILASYSMGALILLVYLASGRGLVSLAWKNCQPSWTHMREILGVGSFASLNVLQTQLILIVTTGLMASYGQISLAGFGAASRLELLQIPVTFALGSAIITMVATNLGAGQWDRVRRIAWSGMAIAVAIGMLFGAIAYFAAEDWMRLFSNDPGVIAAGALYLNMLAIVLPFMGAGLGLMFGLLGANKAKLPFLAINVRLLIIVAIGWPAVAFWGVAPTTLILILLAAMMIFATVVVAAGYRLFNAGQIK